MTAIIPLGASIFAGEVLLTLSIGTIRTWSKRCLRLAFMTLRGTLGRWAECYRTQTPPFGYLRSRQHWCWLGVLTGSLHNSEPTSLSWPRSIHRLHLPRSRRRLRRYKRSSDASTVAERRLKQKNGPNSSKLVRGLILAKRRAPRIRRVAHLTARRARACPRGAGRARIGRLLSTRTVGPFGVASRPPKRVPSV